MRKQLMKALMGVVLTVALLSASGAAFAYFQMDEADRLRQSEAVNVTLQELFEAESKTTIRMDESTLEGYYIENTGKEPCYVRVKLIVPEVGGKPIFQVGRLLGEGFMEYDFSGPYAGDIREKKTYWKQKGEYLYYCNEETGNVLNRREETDAIYSAVRVNPLITSEEIDASGQQVQSISVYAQCVPVGSSGEDAAWEKFERETGITASN